MIKQKDSLKASLYHGRNSLLIFVLLAIFLYSPVLFKGFAADDFSVLRRFTIDKRFNEPGFFRPLSDLTIYFNYLISGLNSWSYNLFSILVHATTSYFIFKLSQRLAVTAFHIGKPFDFAWVVSLLFLCYPFHNEAIVWMVGRGALLAGFFALLTLLIATKDEGLLAVILAGFCYFAGLLAYETIFPLPLIVFILLFLQGKRRRVLAAYMVSMTGFLILHLFIRISVSGTFLGGYGETVANIGVTGYVNHIVKFVARLYTPPIENSWLFSGLAAVLLVGFIIVFISAFQHQKFGKSFRISIFGLIAILAVSMLVSISFPLSTKTSESDRLIYFSSIFYCVLIGAVLFNVNLQSKTRLFVITAIILFQVVNLELNNLNWKRADSITKRILKTVKQEIIGDTRVMILNLPGEYKGAMIFRTGFYDALLLNQVDTSMIDVLNVLNHQESRLLIDPISPRVNLDTTAVGNILLLRNGEIFQRSFRDSNVITKTEQNFQNYNLWYWDGDTLKPLSGPDAPDRKQMKK